MGRSSATDHIVYAVSLESTVQMFAQDNVGGVGLTLLGKHRMWFTHDLKFPSTTTTTTNQFNRYQLPRRSARVAWPVVPRYVDTCFHQWHKFLLVVDHSTYRQKPSPFRRCRPSWVSSAPSLSIHTTPRNRSLICAIKTLLPLLVYLLARSHTLRTWRFPWCTHVSALFGIEAHRCTTFTCHYSHHLQTSLHDWPTSLFRQIMQRHLSWIFLSQGISHVLSVDLHHSDIFQHNSAVGASNNDRSSLNTSIILHRVSTRMQLVKVVIHFGPYSSTQGICYRYGLIVGSFNICHHILNSCITGAQANYTSRTFHQNNGKRSTCERCRLVKRSQTRSFRWFGRPYYKVVVLWVSRPTRGV
jgi:hypothetical protein